MTDIPQYKNWTKIEPLNKGWSSDKKYYIETKDGEKLLLRVSDISEYDKKKAEYEAIKKLDNFDILMSRPLDFGAFNSSKNVYMLLTWIDGEDAESVLPTLNKKEQYQLGIKAGEFMRKIHSIPAPKNQMPWAKRFNAKIDNKISVYKKCGIKIPNDNAIINYLNQNRFLLNDRPQSFQHGDYHAGNMIITPNGELGIIDFNRFDYGDPWEEFNRIVWCSSVSNHFATGRINGYFDGDVPNEFFRLMALYIASNQLSSVYWAIQFGQDEIDTMLKQASDMIDYYDGMTNVVPKWYIGGKIDA